MESPLHIVCHTLVRANRHSLCLGSSDVQIVLRGIDRASRIPASNYRDSRFIIRAERKLGDRRKPDMKASTYAWPPQLNNQATPLGDKLWFNSVDVNRQPSAVDAFFYRYDVINGSSRVSTGFERRESPKRIGAYGCYVLTPKSCERRNPQGIHRNFPNFCMHTP